MVMWTCSPAGLSGTYSPEPGSLAGFLGGDASGTWTLNVVDNAGGDLGTLVSWSLIFTLPDPGGTPCGDAFPDQCTPVLTLLILDEETIDNGISTIEAAASDLGVSAAELVNDDQPTEDGNPPLRWSDLWSCGSPNNPDPDPSCEVVLPSGQLCDEGVYVLPQDTPWSVGDFVAGTVPQSQLDEIVGVTPLHTAHLLDLVGTSCVAVVYDSDISMNYGPINGNLTGGRYGLLFFTVLDVIPPSESADSSSSQWDLVVRIDPSIPLGEFDVVSPDFVNDGECGQTGGTGNRRRNAGIDR